MPVICSKPRAGSSDLMSKAEPTTRVIWPALAAWRDGDAAALPAPSMAITRSVKTEPRVLRMPASSCECSHHRVANRGCQRRPTLLHHLEVAAVVGQQAPAALLDHHHVLGAGAEAAGDEDAGLDGEAHAAAQDGLVAAVQVGRLVHVQADAVS